MVCPTDKLSTDSTIIRKSDHSYHKAVTLWMEMAVSILARYNTQAEGRRKGRSSGSFPLRLLPEIMPIPFLLRSL
jgi:hypothetical protein